MGFTDNHIVPIGLEFSPNIGENHLPTATLTPSDLPFGNTSLTLCFTGNSNIMSPPIWAYQLSQKELVTIAFESCGSMLSSTCTAVGKSILSAIKDNGRKMSNSKIYIFFFIFLVLSICVLSVNPARINRNRME